MLNITRGATEKFLADMDRTQSQIDKVSGQVSSGIRVQQPSDDPGALAEIATLQGAIGMNQQVQANLGSATNEVGTAEGALQSAIQAVENAISLGAQGATSTSTAQARSILATQIQGLQETLVGISQTTVNGRYIFSGDQDRSPAYKLDLSQPSGVQRLLTASSTRVIQDATGTAISVAKTAGEIFDPRNPDDTPATGNAFAALNALRVALQNNDSAGIAQAQDALKQADSHLNVAEAFYGNAQTRLASATNIAQRFQVNQQKQLSDLRDTDVASAALELTQAQTQQQASLAAQSKRTSMNLFDYLT